MKGFKTIFYGAFVAIGAPLLGYIQTTYDALKTCQVNPASNEQICAMGVPVWAVSLIGVGIIALRAVTTTALFKKA